MYESTYYTVMYIYIITFVCVYTVQLRCNFTLACEQFICTCMELLMACALLPLRNSHKIIIWSLGVVSDMVTHVSLGYHVIDHYNVHRLVHGLVSHTL